MDFLSFILNIDSWKTEKSLKNLGNMDIFSDVGSVYMV